MRRDYHKQYEFRDWRFALAASGARVARRLGRRLTESEWERLERARFNTDELIGRQLLMSGRYRLAHCDGRLVMRRAA